MSDERCSNIITPKNPEDKLRFVKELCQPLELSCDTLKKVKALFLKEIEMGLKRKPTARASIKCVPTYIQNLPTACEKGKCFVIEIFGKSFYILLLTFNGTKECKETCEKCVFPEHLLATDATSLGNYMAECLCRFVKKLSLHWENLPLAISLALYARQDHAHPWERNFNIPTQTCESLVEILQKAFESRGDVKLSNYVLVNDTAAVLMSSAWSNNYSKIGLIVDKGCSACYLEQIKHMASLENSRTLAIIPTMIVNTEWASFGDNGSLDFICTPWDARVDEFSATKTEHKFEKLVSGDSIGSLVHSILLDSINMGALLEGNLTAALNTANSFPTSYVIEIESQSNNNSFKTKNILRTVGYANPGIVDCDIVRFICETVTRRAIHLVAAALAGLIDHIGDPYVIVGVEGFICRHRPNYREDLQLKLSELVKPGHKFDIIFPLAGRGCGAALTAFEMVRRNKMFNFKTSALANETLLNIRPKKSICIRKRKTKKKFAGKANATKNCKVQK